jgi:hypothetical protein
MIEIEDKQKIVPDAYHGTSQETAEQIQKEERFLPSTGEDQYLGNGVYFFESSEWHARDWARKRCGDGKIGIICAGIDLGRCLDLNNGEHRGFIKTVAIKLAKMSGKAVTDALVINFITSYSAKVDTVRASYLGVNYQGGKKIFPGSHFYDYSQLMICVKNLGNIKKFSITYLGY